MLLESVWLKGGPVRIKVTRKSKKLEIYSMTAEGTELSHNHYELKLGIDTSILAKEIITRFSPKNKELRIYDQLFVKNLLDAMIL